MLPSVLASSPMLRRAPVLSLLVLLACLQGLAPLLHDHLGGQQIRHGVHAHFGIEGVARDDGQHHARGDEFPDVGVGQLIERRVSLLVPPQPALAAPPVRTPSPERLVVGADATGADASPRAPRSLPPPALAPPIFPA